MGPPISAFTLSDTVFRAPKQTGRSIGGRPVAVGRNADAAGRLSADGEPLLHRQDSAAETASVLWRSPAPRVGVPP